MEERIDRLTEKLAELISKYEGDELKDIMVQIILALFSRTETSVYSGLAILAVTESFLYKQIWESSARKKRGGYVA